MSQTKRFIIPTTIAVLLLVGAGSLMLWKSGSIKFDQSSLPLTKVIDGEKQTQTVDDSLLAQALLTAPDLNSISRFSHSRPTLTELNHHLDPILKDYEFYVAKSWFDRDYERMNMQNSIIKYVSAEAAQKSMMERAKGFETITIKASQEDIGDARIAYYQPGESGEDPHIVYRFTLGIYGVKIALPTTAKQIANDADQKTGLAALASQIAKVQSQRLVDLSKDKLTIATNNAMQRLPEKISGTQWIGTLPVSDQEWLGTQHEFKADTLPGFVSAGLSRFAILERPNEIVEVTVLEFKTSADAQRFQSELVPFAQSQEGEVLKLPPSLIAKKADAVAQKFGMVELQAAPSNYVVDVSIFAPFADTNMEMAKKDIIKMSEEALEKM
ncbi:MAG: hypothetical protein HY817_04985 [Candidatus Abawacabacteria bacterium]|nr:hypothetical protein [Candidatus Abawacabacteria bacterium]